MNNSDDQLDIPIISDNLTISVSSNGYWFGQEVIELVNFLPSKKWNNAIDLGCGDGVIPFLLERRELVRHDIWAVDIDDDHCRRSRLNIDRNHLTGRIQVLNKNIRVLRNVFKKGSFDLITANPPFFPVYQDHQNLSSDEISGRQELSGNLRFFLQAADYLICHKGDLFLLYHPSRFDEMFFELNRTQIRCKELQILHHRDGRALFVICHGIKNGNPGMKVLPAKTLDKSFKSNLRNS